MLIYVPANHTANAFSDNPGCHSSEESKETVVFVDFLECVKNAGVDLVLMLIVELEQYSSSDNVNWMSNHSANYGRSERGC